MSGRAQNPTDMAWKRETEKEKEKEKERKRNEKESKESKPPTANRQPPSR